ncbi:MAG: hypothetical protein C4541_11220 [Candidatus Auribacter fodinae]|uniref:Uncharacterized protein n=1 Tax=Candidatus Auribacter fodinae TaxID=2093366 RepID=A0A3A4QSF0_9BACT|nr:MAG: hypothetical protein C4541_11220 [Candidatus Auribacter fodinae]
MDKNLRNILCKFMKKSEKMDLETAASSFVELGPVIPALSGFDNQIFLVGVALGKHISCSI